MARESSYEALILERLQTTPYASRRSRKLPASTMKMALGRFPFFMAASAASQSWANIHLPNCVLAGVLCANFGTKVCPEIVIERLVSLTLSTNALVLLELDWASWRRRWELSCYEQTRSSTRARCCQQGNSQPRTVSLLVEASCKELVREVEHVNDGPLFFSAEVGVNLNNWCWCCIASGRGNQFLPFRL
jgi:hypothetical protein